LLNFLELRASGKGAKILTVEYAIVDIETTGGYAAGNGITEISIHIFDGLRVVETYESLVNPGQAIPRSIQSLTGIDNEMVAEAPYFPEIASDVYRLLSGRVFVAHNVNFDFSFVKSHLAACGFDLQCRKLCTVRLARKLLPGYPSYSLGNLCHSLGIGLHNRHRAGGDAAATVSLFMRLLDADQEGFIAKSLKKTSKEQTLPPHVPQDDFRQLPSCPGVYYFHDSKGKVVYVGKAKNLRSRVNSHFSNNSDSQQKQNFLRDVHRITFQPMATELMAALLESTEIRRLWPPFNQAQKKQEDQYGIFTYEDRAGYLRLAVEKRRRHSRPVYTFHYQVDGHTLLRRLVGMHALCPRLCFLQTDQEPCTGSDGDPCRGACEKREAPERYNERVRAALEELTRQPSFVIVDDGINADEKACILILNGSFYGMGYLPRSFDTLTPDAVKEQVQPYKENSHIRTLISSYAVQHPAQVHYFSQQPSGRDQSPAAIIPE